MRKRTKAACLRHALLPLACMLAGPAHAGSPEGRLAAGVDRALAAELTDQIIVRLRSSAAKAPTLEAAAHEQVRLAAGLQGLVVRPHRETGGGSTVWKLDRPVPLAQAEAIARRVAAAAGGEVEFAHADPLARAAMTPGDPYWNSLWSYADTNAGISLPLAWDISTGAGVTVAVIDTGYRPHADLAGQILPGWDFIGDPAVANDGSGRDADAQDPGDWGGNWNNLCTTTSSWHGTHVSGTVAALANNGQGGLGVAFGARLLPARVLGRCGGYLSDTADAIRWTSGNAVAGVPANPTPARVLNLSLSGNGGCSSELAGAVSAARSAGAIVVVAAGNDNVDASTRWPGNCAGVLTVAATNTGGGKASYSNYGSVVGIAAPGDGIVSTLNAGTTSPGADSYAFYFGTSMAAPHVAGVAALVASVNPNLSGDQIAGILKTTTKAFPLACVGCGSGLLNAKAAVDSAVLSRTRLSALPTSVSIAGYGGLDFYATVTVKNTGTVNLGPISSSIARTAGSGNFLAFDTDGCAGMTLNPGGSCQIVLDMIAGCGTAKSTRWNLNVAAVGASSTLVVPISGTSSAGICY